ncbi:hypothetical protein L195_g015714 [Trifolium pratense]|uniref:Uncharacterized protein n=1 Tax=Trifolium pratense TaxID=57577 RepID=A0A2K3MPC8_TRIPR|nr:hypothetical protein L195_g015714 [Trifolium pratense]
MYNPALDATMQHRTTVDYVDSKNKTRTSKNHQTRALASINGNIVTGIIDPRALGGMRFLLEGTISHLLDIPLEENAVEKLYL